MYAVASGALLIFLYASTTGQAILNSAKGNIIGVVQGLNIATGLIMLSLILGYGMVKIPLKLWKCSKLKQTWKYLQFKVAFH